ncbi:MAG: hypothetical protein JXB49_01260, partial [Bacteroidales bacterium]|nr:hypothetical protein [Bacteroidales bacterium]
MKKLFTLFVIIALTFSVFAQAPQKMSYQAVIRNTTGGLVTNHAVGMRISILQGSASGTVVYRETYSPVPQTNANGLVTVEIGSGIPSTGTFPGINWGAGPYYIKTETDPNGGTSYTIIGTSQLLSVPYALNSKMSESIADNSVTSAKIVDGTITSGDIGNNAINSTKIQDGSVVTADLADNTVSTDKLGNLAVSTEKIQNTSVTAVKLSAMGATSGQVLRWSGTAWEPAIDGLTLPFTGSSNTGTYGIRIEHTNDQNRDSYAG